MKTYLSRSLLFVAALAAVAVAASSASAAVADAFPALAPFFSVLFGGDGSVIFAMATVTSTAWPTLAEVIKRTEPDGNISKIAEMLTQKNEILMDMPWVECNDGTAHKTTVRNGLPSAAWRQLNYGVPSSKSATTRVQETTGMLETYAKIDLALANLNNNSAAWRMSEETAFREAMNQQMASTLFYGDTGVNPERFLGLSARFNTTSGAENARNIIKADSGASGSDQTSVWLIVWGDQTVHGLYPKGSQGGLQVRDLGEDTASDGAGGEYQILRTHYKWDCGLSVRDWRYVVRVCNIDTSALTKNAASGADLIDALTLALEAVEDLTSGTPVFYANRTVTSFLRRQIVNKVAASTLSMQEVGGRRVLDFDGVPVRRTDALLNTEAVIS